MTKTPSHPLTCPTCLLVLPLPLRLVPLPVQRPMVPPLEPLCLYPLLRHLCSKVLESKHLRLPVTHIPILEFNQLEFPTNLVRDLLMRY